jgi:hypothetical protein
VTVAYTPASAGAFTGNILFTSNAGNSPTTVSLTGYGSSMAPPPGTQSIAVLQTDQTTLAFGDVPQGTTTQISLRITLTGNAQLVIGTASVSGCCWAIVSPTFPVSLDPGANQVVNVSFTPSNVGAVTGTLSLSSNAKQPTTLITLIGNGAGIPSVPTYLLQASPNTIDFSTVAVNRTVTQVFSLLNVGNSAVTIQQGSVSGCCFQLLTTFPFDLQPAALQDIVVTYTPTTLTSNSGVVSFMTNATNPISVTLSGTGVGPHEVDLTWSAVSDNGVPITYNVYRSSFPGVLYEKIGNTSNISFVAPNVRAGTTYYYVVTAQDPYQDESAYSNEAAATVPTP